MSKATEPLRKIWAVIQKYKYAVLILVIGIGLLLLPGGKEEKTIVSAPVESSLPVQASYETELENKLEAILSQIHGVGRVQVILTVKQGEETHYLLDRDIRTGSGESNPTVEESEKAVIISRGSSYDEPIVTKKDYPLFQGALIVCEGGGDAEVKLQITEAVAALTNLSSHNITILKMK